MSGFVTEYRLAFRAFNRNARLILAYYAVSAFAQGIVSVLYNLYFLRCGFDENFLGSMLMVQGVALAACLIPVGIFSDRLPKHRLVVIGYLVMNGAFTLIILGRSRTALLGLNVINSVGLAIATGSEYPYLSENASPEARTHLFSMVMAIFSAVPSLGMVIGGYLPTVFSRYLGCGTESALAYRASLLVGVALFWFSGVFALRIKSSPNPVRKTGTLTLRISEPGIVTGLAVNAALISCAASLFMPYMNVIFSSRFNMTTASIGWVFMIQNLLVAAFSLLAPRISQRHGKVGAIASLQAVGIVLVLSMAFARSVLLFMVAYILRSSIMTAVLPLSDSMAMEVVGEDQRGMVHSIMNLSRNLAGALGSKLGGTFLAARMYSVPLVSASCAYFAGIGLCLLILAPRVARRVIGAQGTAFDDPPVT